MEDIFVPKSSAADALVSPLHTITYVTSDPAAVERILKDGYGLKGSEWQRPDNGARAALNDYLGFDRSHTWSVAAFVKSGAGANVQIRVIGLDQETPLVREAYHGLFVGGATISFPIADLRAHEQRMLTLGVESTMGVKELEFTSPEGETYVSAEVVYKAPDNIFVMGVTRPDVFVPVGPVDEATGIGGPAYSARCVARTDATISFFSDVLGYEVRRDMVIVVDETSAINLPQGTEERFVQAFAPGASTGYVIFMDHGAATMTAVDQPGPPNRGIVMWSFESRDLEEVERRAERAGATVLAKSAERLSPFLPGGRSLLLRDPDGFPIEVFAAV